MGDWISYTPKAYRMLPIPCRKPVHDFRCRHSIHQLFERQLSATIRGFFCTESFGVPALPIHAYKSSLALALIADSQVYFLLCSRISVEFKQSFNGNLSTPYNTELLTLFGMYRREVVSLIMSSPMDRLLAICKS